MAKKEKENKNKQKLVFNEKEYIFNAEDLTIEALGQYRRANQLASEIIQIEAALVEKRFLVNNYISFVVSELDNDETKKDIDDKKKK